MLANFDKRQNTYSYSEFSSLPSKVSPDDRDDNWTITHNATGTALEEDQEKEDIVVGVLALKERRQ